MSAAPRPYSTPSRDDGLERIGVPFLARPGRHDVGVTGEAEHRAAPSRGVTRGCPPGRSVRRSLRNPSGLEPGADDVEAAVVLGADRGSAQQVFGQGEGR